MCGIIGVIGTEQAPEQLLSSLKRLEYRGYDSAGIAVQQPDGSIARARAEGKLTNLETTLKASPIQGNIGIGHTRWATHGIPNEANAHPHATSDVAVVHNGIIENFKELRDELEAAGHTFHSQTDTEVIPILITHHLKQGDTPKQAVANTLKRLHGAFALGILFAADKEHIYAARRGSPLAIGYGENTMYLGSDAIALAPLTPRIAYLEEGDWAQINAQGATIFDENDNEVTREIHTSSHTSDAIGKGNYRHFMEKEIHEQPSVTGDALNVFYNPTTAEIHLPDLHLPLKDINHITLVACGTSYYAALTARYWLEQYAGVAVEIDVASEFRYRTHNQPKDSLCIFISQSGETADTLAALRAMKERGNYCLAIVNVPESSMAKEADGTLFTHAGPEIGVASTKAFTTQLVTLACLTLALAIAKRSITHEEEDALSHAIAEVPALMAEVLHHDEAIAELATQFKETRDALYIGRGTSYAIALEGALKLKEISYIHAEGYAAGELKHGPIALIDEEVPVIALAPSDAWFEKTASNIQEAAARGGKMILISDKAGIKKAGDTMFSSIEMPKVHPFVAPILYAIPIQLLAYHVALLKGTDVDQPRNLAKSVTVE